MFINGKNSYDEIIDADVKQYEETRKLPTWQDADYTSGCLLNYDHIKDHYRLIALELSRQKELDADPKAIQQRKFVA